MSVSVCVHKSQDGIIVIRKNVDSKNAGMIYKYKPFVFNVLTDWGRTHTSSWGTPALMTTRDSRDNGLVHGADLLGPVPVRHE